MLKMFVRQMSSSTIKVKPPISVFGIEGRYVTALYSAGSQKNELDQIEKSLSSLLPELQKPKIKDFLETSLVSRADKAKLFQDVATATGMPSCCTNFLACVAENGRLKMLRKIISSFLTVMVAHRKQALCEVITAKPLDDSMRSALINALKKLAKGKNITLTERVDPSIIGGIIVGVEDKHIDMSIARKIQTYTDILKMSI